MSTLQCVYCRQFWPSIQLTRWLVHIYRCVREIRYRRGEAA